MIAPSRYNSLVTSSRCLRRASWRSTLRSDGREEVCREQQQECQRHGGHAQLDPHVEENAEQGEQVRRLAHEQVVQHHVRHDQDETRPHPRHPAHRARETLAEESHETQFVELAAEREEHREPDVRRQDVAFLGDVLQREHAGGQQHAEAEKRNRGRVKCSVAAVAHNTTMTTKVADTIFSWAPSGPSDARAARAAAGAAGVAVTSGAISL